MNFGELSDIMSGLICIQLCIYLSFRTLIKLGYKMNAGDTIEFGELWLMIFIAIICACVEEVIFRYGLRNLLLYMNFDEFQCMYITSMSFSFAHVINYFKNYNLPYIIHQILFTFPVGCLYYQGIFLSHEYPLLYPILLHMYFNMSQVLICNSLVLKAIDDNVEDKIFYKSIRKRSNSLNNLQSTKINEYMVIRVNKKYNYMHDKKLF